MDAIETLMNEHRTIELGLDALVAFAEQTVRGDRDGRSELARFVRFIREYADAHHHGKEEKILFEAMVSAGFPLHGGPIAVMLHEHDQGRALVGELARLASQAEAWTADDRQRVAEAAIGFAELLRHHIQKEDSILYPMAQARLPDDALVEVTVRCEQYEREAAARQVQAGLEQLAAELVASHAPGAVRREHPRPMFHGGCC
jgi:hemerythrin-like domain-containing protein